MLAELEKMWNEVYLFPENILSLSKLDNTSTYVKYKILLCVKYTDMSFPSPLTD